MSCLKFFLSGPCIHFTFWNNAGVPFIICSSLKPEGHYVTGPKLHLRYVIQNGVLKGLQPTKLKRSRVADDGEEVLSRVTCFSRIVYFGKKAYLT